jgi:hypothetical protein
MMNSEATTQAHIDELLTFLPIFEQPEGPFVLEYTPYPQYAPEVQAFFSLAGGTFWSDFGYDPKTAYAMLEDDEQVRTATLEQIKTMLTACVRGERFCDGFWASMLEEGKIVKLLRRLQVLRQSL